MRCFPEFIRSIPQILTQNPHARFEIAGEDQTFYGGKPKNSSWGKWAKGELKAAGLNDKVTWLGRLDLDTYTQWISNSSCHVYLTHPFVASWSLVETFCCNTPIVASDVRPVHEICSDSNGVLYCDHRSATSVAKGVVECLDLSNSSTPELTTARSFDRFGVGKSLLGWSLVAGLDLTTGN